MAYYLSKRNQKLLTPYLKLLDVSDKSVTLNSQTPESLRNLLRSAFNTSHPHLKDKYKLKILNNSVICELKPSLELTNNEEVVELFDIAQDIMSNNIPVKYLNTLLSEEDYSSLQSLAQSKSLLLKYNPPTLEISYE